MPTRTAYAGPSWSAAVIMKEVRRLFPFILFPFAVSLPLRAQDSFEIQVYEAETVPKGRWNLETHLNFTGDGTKEFEGTVAPTQHQFHMTFELTYGITRHLETAVYLLLAERPGAGWEFAGWRIRPRVGVPKEWNWPIGASLSLEVAFPQPAYEENSATLEIRPILEKRLGRWQIDINPVVTKVLSGPGSGEGWGFEPAARVAYEAGKKLDLSVEYYGGIGPFRNVLPASEQSHQIYPGGDWQISENVVLNFGVGFALTKSSADLVGKLRLGILFGRD